jgi:hypothetical protein
MKTTLVVVLTVLASLPVFAEDIVLDYGGRKVVLHDDGTWEYAKTSNTGAVQGLTLHKLPTQTQLLTNPTGKYKVNFDPKLWDQTKPFSESAEFGFQNKEKTGFGMAIYDGLPLPLTTMEQVLITNANNIDKNAAIVDKQPCTVNGVAGELVTYTATGSGVPFTLLTFITSGDFGSIQYTFYTTSAVFAKMKPVFIDAISGIEF